MNFGRDTNLISYTYDEDHSRLLHVIWREHNTVHNKPVKPKILSSPLQNKFPKLEGIDNQHIHQHSTLETDF